MLIGQPVKFVPMSRPAGTERLTDLAELDVIVDADGHAQETFEDIRTHLDDGFDRFERFLERAPAPGTEMDLFASPTPTYLYEKMGDDGGEASLYASNRLTRTEELATELGIDRVVVNPTLNINLSFVKSADYAAGMMNGYNNWLLSELDRYENMVGNAIVAPQDPELAADEIDRVGGDSNVAGVQLHGTGLVPPAGHSMYDPIYDAAGRHDLPVCMHTSGAGMKSFPEQSMWAETYAEDHVTQHPFAHMWNLTSLLCRGVPHRHPDVLFVFQEAGIGYVPYILNRLDTAFHEFRHELPALEKPPSEYVSDTFYWTTQPLGHTAETPRHLARLVELIGPENLMFSADIPHPDFDTPEELFDRIRPYFDAESIRGMMGETAIEVFDIA